MCFLREPFAYRQRLAQTNTSYNTNYAFSVHVFTQQNGFYSEYMNEVSQKKRKKGLHPKIIVGMLERIPKCSSYKLWQNIYKMHNWDEASGQRNNAIELAEK